MRFQIFQPQFQLQDLLVKLLGLAPELHSLQFEDKQFEMVNLVVARAEFFLLQENQRSQRIRIETVQIRQREARSSHRLIMPFRLSAEKRMKPFSAFLFKFFILRFAAWSSASDGA